MKTLLRVIGIIVAVFVVLLLLGYALPSEVKVKREIVINASAEKVFPYINNMQRFGAWSPWRDIDPNAEYSLSGPEEGVGAKVEWKSDHKDLGNGSQEIVESIPNEKVRTELYFNEDEEANYADLLLEAHEEGTQITWTFEGNMGSNPVARYVGLFLDKLLGPSYEEGLANLKELVEQGSVVESFEDVTLAPQAVVGIRTTVPMADISTKMEEDFTALRAYAVRELADQEKNYVSVYFKWEPEEVSYLAGVLAESAQSDEVEPYTIAGGQYVKAVHQGDYSQLSLVHGEIAEHLKARNLEVAGPVYEHYVVMQEPTPDGKGLTEIAPTTHVYYPVIEAAEAQEEVSTENPEEEEPQ